MKSQSNQQPKPKARIADMRIMNEDIDRMQEDMQKSLINGDDSKAKSINVKLIRSRSQTKLTFMLKGTLEETEDRLQKIYNALKN